MARQKSRPPTPADKPVSATDPSAFVPRPTDIVPTHSCFDDAIELLTRIVPRDSPSTFHLAHGIFRGAATGERYAHAWVEESGRGVGTWMSRAPLPCSVAWQSGMIRGQAVYFALPLAEYHRMMDVERVWRYTPYEMARHMFKTMSAGPWVQDVIDLCSDDGRIVGRVTGARPLAVIAVERTEVEL